MPELLDPRSYARHREDAGLPGITADAVRIAIRQGRLRESVTEVEGRWRIDPELADAEWAANTSTVRQPNLNAGRKPAPLADGETMADLQVEHEKLKIAERALRLRRARGEVVVWRPYRRQLLEFVRRERDFWGTWPSRVARRLADEFGAELSRMQVALEREIRDALRELAEKAPLDAGTLVPAEVRERVVVEAADDEDGVGDDDDGERVGAG